MCVWGNYECLGNLWVFGKTTDVQGNFGCFRKTVGVLGSYVCLRKLYVFWETMGVWGNYEWVTYECFEKLQGETMCV